MKKVFSVFTVKENSLAKCVLSVSMLELMLHCLPESHRYFHTVIIFIYIHIIFKYRFQQVYFTAVLINMAWHQASHVPSRNLIFFSLIWAVQATNITFNAAIVRPASSITDVYTICKFNSSVGLQWEVDRCSAGYHSASARFGDVAHQTNADVTLATTAAILISRNDGHNYSLSLLAMFNITGQNHQIACLGGAVASSYNYTGDRGTDSVLVQRDGDAEIFRIAVIKDAVICMCTTYGTQEWVVNGISVGGFSINNSRSGHHKTEHPFFGVWSIILHVSSNKPSKNDLVSILVLLLQENTNLTVSCKGKSGEANLYVFEDGTVETTLDVPGSSDSSSAHSTVVTMTTWIYRKQSWGCGIN